MRGKVNYSGHALHNKTVEIDGEDFIRTQSGFKIGVGYRIPMPEGHVILLPKDKVRVLAEAA